MRPQALATLVLSLLALLFGWETRQALLATPGGRDNAVTASPGAWHPGVATPDPQPPPDPAPAAAAVAARPLFRPDRQPFREQSAGASVRNYDAELSRFTLIGVLGFGDAPVGVVIGKAGTKGDRWEVRKGDSFQGFKVKEVGMEGVRLTADGKEFLLPLYAGAPTAAGGAARTEAIRHDAAQPPSAPRAAAPSPASSPPGPIPGIPPASPLSPRLRRTPSGPIAPGISPDSSTPVPPPVAPQRYIPGRR